jgi:hypothetical protein
MKRLRRIKPSPSMVVASIALLVALGGTSIAAVAVTVPRNSIGTLQLRDNSVVSSKVKNGSLLARDFRSGQLPRGLRGVQGPAGPAGPAGAAGPAGPAGATGPAGLASPGYVAEVINASTTSSSSNSSDSWSTISGSSTTVTVPTGETDKLVAFFSGTSACYGGPDNTTQRCSIRITVDGNELSPALDTDSVFDSAENDTDAPTTSGSRASHTMVRYSGNLSAGAHTVLVQQQVSNTSTTFRLVGWDLTIERIKAA